MSRLSTTSSSNGAGQYNRRGDRVLWKSGEYSYGVRRQAVKHPDATARVFVGCPSTSRRRGLPHGAGSRDEHELSSLYQDSGLSTGTEARAAAINSMSTMAGRNDTAAGDDGDIGRNGPYQSVGGRSDGNEPRRRVGRGDGRYRAAGERTSRADERTGDGRAAHHTGGRGRRRRARAHTRARTTGATSTRAGRNGSDKHAVPGVGTTRAQFRAGPSHDRASSLGGSCPRPHGRRDTRHRLHTEDQGCRYHPHGSRQQVGMVARLIDDTNLLVDQRSQRPRQPIKLNTNLLVDQRSQRPRQPIRLNTNLLVDQKSQRPRQPIRLDTNKHGSGSRSRSKHARLPDVRTHPVQCEHSPQPGSLTWWINRPGELGHGKSGLARFVRRSMCLFRHPHPPNRIFSKHKLPPEFQGASGPQFNRSSCFPLPLPTRPTLPCNRSARARARHVRRLASWGGVLAAILGLNYLAAPGASLAALRKSAGGSSTLVQQAMVQTVTAAVRKSVRGGPCGPDTSGHKMGNIMNLIDEVGQLSADVERQTYGRVVSRDKWRDEIDPYAKKAVTLVQGGEVTTTTTGPLAVVADRVALPERGACLELEPFLRRIDAEVADAFVKPELLAVDQPPTTERSYSKISRNDMVRLLTRLDKAGLLLLMPNTSVSSQRMGMFAVEKDETEDRLIFDRRPQNARERSLGRLKDSLPHPSCWTQMILEQDECARISIADLRVYYYSVARNEAAAKTNAFYDVMNVQDIRDLEAYKALSPEHQEAAEMGVLRIVACFRGLAMGDINGTDYAQVGHLGILDAGDGLVPKGLVTYRKPFPRGSLSQGIYIDDHVLVQVLPRQRCRFVDGTVEYRRTARDSPSEDDPQDEVYFQRALDAYERAKVAPKPSKTVKNAASAKVLGGILDGWAGTMGSDRGKRILLADAAYRTARGGIATGQLLGSIVGMWVHFAMFRRPMLCLMDKLFALPRDDRVGSFVLPSNAADELRLLACLSPLMESDLHARVEPRIYATDASPWRGAGGYQDVPPHVARELYRVAEHRGARVQMTTSVEQYVNDHNLLPEPDKMPWVAELLQPLAFKTSFAYDFKTPGHINVNERLAYNTLIKSLSMSRATHKSRPVVVLDSRVTIGGAARGRSSARSLLSLQRASLPYVLGADLYPVHLWTPSEEMPMDGPSRGRPIRPPRPAEQWVTAFFNGDTQAFDKRTHDRYSGVRVGEAKKV